MKTCAELYKIIDQGEGQKLEFKNSLILRDSIKLARTMASFANAQGGRILIGVSDDGEFEGMTANKNDEEIIMNIASDRCDPRLIPLFSKISCQGKGDVYVVEVPQRQEMFHSVKIKNGIVFPVRVGSTVRQLSARELGFADQGIEIGVRKTISRVWLGLGKASLKKFFSTLTPTNDEIRKYQVLLLGTAFLLIGLPLGMMFSFNGIELTSKFIDYPTWIHFSLIFSILTGASVLNFFGHISKTKCSNCNSYFTFETIRKWVLDKRQIDDRTEEWVTRSLKKCSECDYEVLGNRRYEVRSIEEEYGPHARARETQ